MKKLFLIYGFFFLFIISCSHDNDLDIEESENAITLKSTSSFPQNLWVIYKGCNTNNLWYTYSNNTGNAFSWIGNTSFNNGAKTSHGLDAEHFNGKIITIYKGESSTKLYSSYSSNGTTWSGNWQLLNAETNDVPVLVKHGGRLYAFYKGKSSNTIWMAYTYGTVNSSGHLTWYGNVPTTRTTSVWPIAATSHNGKIYIAEGGWRDIFSYRYDINLSSSSDGKNFVYENRLQFRGANGYARRGIHEIISHNGLLYLFVSPFTDPLLDVYYLNTSTIKWTYIKTLGQTNKKPSATVYGDNLFVVWKGDPEAGLLNNCDDFWYSIYSQGQWASEKNITTPANTKLEPTIVAF